MATKGRIKYVPAEIIDLIGKIKKERSYKKDSKAFREMVNYAEMGREVERITSFIFPTRKKKKKKVRK